MCFLKICGHPQVQVVGATADFALVTIAWHIAIAAVSWHASVEKHNSAIAFPRVFSSRQGVVPILASLQTIFCCQCRRVNVLLPANGTSTCSLRIAASGLVVRDDGMVHFREGRVHVNRNHTGPSADLSLVASTSIGTVLWRGCWT